MGTKQKSARKTVTKRSRSRPSTRERVQSSRERAPLTPLQQERRIAMIRARDGRGVTTVDLHKALAENGRHVSRRTVQAVLLDEFRNDDVESVFCELTGTPRSWMFPDDAIAPGVNAKLVEHAERVPYRRGAGAA